MKQKLVIIITIIIVLLLTGCTAITSDNKKMLNNAEEVERFIEDVLENSNNIWSYYGVTAKKTNTNEHLDTYRVYGNVKTESIDYNFNEILVWKNFRVDVYVYENDVITKNWDFF